MFERPVPGFLGIAGKAASRKLPAFEVIADTIAANAFACAGLIAAIAGLKVFFFFTLHLRFLSRLSVDFQHYGRVNHFLFHGIDIYHEITH